MANGFCSSLLLTMEAVQNGNATRKLGTNGFLKSLLCCQDSAANILNDTFSQGHTRPVSVSYLPRITEADVADEMIGCDTGISRVKQEYTLPALTTYSASEIIDHATIAQFCIDASQCVTIDGEGNNCMDGALMPSAMKEVYNRILDLSSAVLRAANTGLSTAMMPQFGENVLTSAYTATDITIPSGDTALTATTIELMRIIRENEFCNDFCIVGNGSYMNIDIIRNALSCCNDQGLNTGNIANMVNNIFYDRATATTWGENYVGVFEKGAVQLVNRNLYSGNFGGRLGNSTFFTMTLPVDQFACANECLEALTFDVQIREYDCDTTGTVNGYSGNITKGYQIVVSKTVGLFVQPTGLYSDGDPLAGTNGTLLFDIASA